MKKYVLFAITLLVFITACKKEDNNANTGNNPAPAPTKKELITAKPWKYKSWTVNPALKDSMGNDYTDYLNHLRTCQTDDLLILQSNGTAQIDEGPTKCDAANPQTQTSTWNFINNEEALKIDGFTYIISALSAESLTLKFDDMQGSTKISHTIVFGH